MTPGNPTIEQQLKTCQKYRADLKKTLDEAIKMAEFYADYSKYIDISDGNEYQARYEIVEDEGEKASQFLKSLEDDNESKN